MRRFTLPVAAALLAAGLAPAARAQAPGVELGHRAQSFILRNKSDHPITAAKARLTDGSEQDFTRNGAIQPNQSQQIVVPGGVCVAGLATTFDNGQQLTLYGPPTCKQTTINVANDRINTESSVSSRAIGRQHQHSGQRMTTP